MILKADHHNRAFTLIEIIITLTVASVLATMIYVYFGKSFSESVTPITSLRTVASLQRVIENIRADYNQHPRWRSGAVYSSGSYIVPTTFNGHRYKSTAGTSGTSEPEWPENSGGTVSDNSITWTESGSSWTSAFLTSLSGKIGAEGTDQTANDYGKNQDGTYTTYNVLTNRFIKFEDGLEKDIETGDSKNILKVTLKETVKFSNEDTDIKLTALFYAY